MEAVMFFFDRSFRSFFLGGSIFAVISMLAWWLSFSGMAQISFSGIAPSYWHAHEMVFGYALATVTGFLLTAVMNWTRADSASGGKLAVLFASWVLARLGYLVDAPLELIAVFDIGFTLGLFLHFFIPVFKAKLWKQAGLFTKFFLLFIANFIYYAGAFGWIDHGINLGIIAGLFLVLAINLTMIRRLVPFFTEKALRLPEQKNSKLLDRLSLVGFLGLMIAAMFFPYHWATAVIAFPLALVNAIRFKLWYHQDIWKVALLWPLHVSYGFMTLGMFLYGFVGLGMLSQSLAIHALAAGGIGLLCSSIMARISLGHTNRNVFNPPKLILWVFIILGITAVIRVILPLALPGYYNLWIQLSQWSWAIGFLILSILYWPILTRRSEEQDTGIRL